MRRREHTPHAPVRGLRIGGDSAGGNDGGDGPPERPRDDGDRNGPSRATLWMCFKLLDVMEQTGMERYTTSEERHG